MKLHIAFTPLLISALLGSSAWAQVDVKDAWVRATVAQQKTTGAFMQLTAAKDSRLVSASSRSAAVVEVHEMSLQGDLMRMRQIPALDLPASKTVELKPGSYHLMLMGLTQPMVAGTTVPLSLVIEDKAGVRQTVEVKAEVRSMSAKSPAGQTSHKH